MLDQTMDDVRNLVDQKRTFYDRWGTVWSRCGRVSGRPSNNPMRDAFYGGHTNAVQLYNRGYVIAGEEIGYDDYTSFYHWVNKYD